MSAEPGQGHDGITATEPWQRPSGRRRRGGSVRRSDSEKIENEVAPGPGYKYTGGGAALAARSLRAPPLRGPNGAVATPGPPCRPDPPPSASCLGFGLSGLMGSYPLFSHARNQRGSRYLSLVHEFATSSPTDVAPRTLVGRAYGRIASSIWLRPHSRIQSKNSKIMPQKCL